jgi:hypothetical protein
MNKFAMNLFYDQCPTLYHPSKQSEGSRRTIEAKALALPGFVHNSEHLEFRLASLAHGT